MAAEKPPTPAYVSPKSLASFFNERRKDPSAKSMIDRSLMTNFSGSTQLELLAALKFLGFINDKGEPHPIYHVYVKADDETRKNMMAEIIKERYPFVFGSPGFDIGSATSLMVADRFRQQQINGSTLSRAVSFFLTACKESGIDVPGDIKAPPMSKPSNGPRPKKEPAAPPPAPLGNTEDEKLKPGVMRFEIPVPNKPSVRVHIPEEFDAEDWELLNTVFAAYIKRWKGYASAKDANKDKGSTPQKE